MTRPSTLNLVPVTSPSVAAPGTRKPDPEPSELAHDAAASPNGARPAPATEAGARPSDERRSDTAVASETHTLTSGVWREWGSFDRTASYRLPAELLNELEERLWDLRIKEVGVTVAAALTHLLDLDDEALYALVERAHAAKPGRRLTARG